MSSQSATYINMKVKKSKVEKAKKYFNVKTNSEVIDKMFDWFDYSKEVNEAMNKVGGSGKGSIKKVYG